MNILQKILCCILPALCFCSVYSQSLALENIHINSQILEFLTEENKAIFKGDVVLTEENFTLYADTLEILYDNSKTDSKITAANGYGNIKIVRPNETVYANTIKYDAATEQISLLNNVQIKQGTILMKSDKYTYNIRTQVSSTRALDSAGNNKRTKIIINNEH